MVGVGDLAGQVLGLRLVGRGTGVDGGTFREVEGSWLEEGKTAIVLQQL